MVFLLGQYKYGGKTAINTFNVQPKQEEFVAKVGEWSIWLPSSQETSAKIAGYDEETKEPYTTWCTARTKGSNLFYHYISKGSEISFLFYIIKDDPSKVNDWLSLGVVGNAKDPINSLKFFFGQNGGLTVNRDNKGLTESHFQEILGDKWGKISRIVMNKVKELGYKNPATESLRLYAADYNLFYKALKNKSSEEITDFCDIISRLNPIEAVSNLAKKLKKDYYEVLKQYKEDNDPEVKPFIDSFAYSFAENESYKFLVEFSNEKFAKPYLDKAAKKCKDPEAILDAYKYNQELLEPYFYEAMKNLANGKPRIFLSKYAEEEWAQDYLDDAFKNIYEEGSSNVFYFLNVNPSLYQKFTKYLPKIFENIINSDPYLVVSRVSQFVDKPFLKDYINKACEKLSDIHPFYFLGVVDSQYDNQPAFEILATYLPNALKKASMENQNMLLELYGDKPWAKETINELPRNFNVFANNVANNYGLFCEELKKKTFEDRYKFIDLISYCNPIIEVSRLINKFEEYPLIILEKYKNQKDPEMEPFIGSIAKDFAEESPEYFLSNFSNEDFAKEYVYPTAKKLAETTPFYFLNNYAYKEWAGEYIDEAARKCLEEDPSRFRRDFCYESWAQEYFTEDNNDENNTEDKIATLSKALRSMGLIKEAATLRLLY
jgi:hypothetical protein